jgi:hypothetical protein
LIPRCRPHRPRISHLINPLFPLLPSPHPPLRLWNAINDPLFGWLSDISGVKRTSAIRWGGLLWCASFLLVWWPWGGAADPSSSSSLSAPTSSTSLSAVLSGVHFALSLCLYDGALTYVELNHSALLTEMTTDPVLRARANAWAAVAAALGTCTSFAAHATWDGGDLTSFRAFAVLLAVACAVIFELSARGLEGGRGLEEGRRHRDGKEEERAGAVEAVDAGAEEGPALLPVSAAAAARRRRQLLGGGSEEGAAEGEKEGGGLSLLAAQASSPDATHEGTSAAACAGVGADCISSAKLTGGAAGPATSLLLDAAGLSAATSASTGAPPLPQSSSSSPHAHTPYSVFLSQILRQRNFIVVAAVFTLQVFDCTFEKNFFAPFATFLARSSGGGGGGAGGGAGAGGEAADLDSAIPHTLLGAVISLSFVLPHAVTLLATPFIATHGLAAVVGGLFWGRLGLLLAALVAGRVNPAAILLFMLANRVSSEAVCRLSPLVAADIVDEDAHLNRRRGRGSGGGGGGGSSGPASASLLGALAFPSKFAQSLAPMLGYALLPDMRAPTDGGGDGGSGSESEASTVWALLLGVPLATVVAQLVLWKGYTLHGPYLKRVKGGGEDGGGEEGGSLV